MRHYLHQCQLSANWAPRNNLPTIKHDSYYSNISFRTIWSDTSGCVWISVPTITQIDANLSSIGPLRTKVSDIWIKALNNSLKKMRLEMPFRSRYADSSKIQNTQDKSEGSVVKKEIWWLHFTIVKNVSATCIERYQICTEYVDCKADNSHVWADWWTYGRTSGRTNVTDGVTTHTPRITEY